MSLVKELIHSKLEVRFGFVYYALPGRFDKSSMLTKISIRFLLMHSDSQLSFWVGDWG